MLQGNCAEIDIIAICITEHVIGGLKPVCLDLWVLQTAACYQTHQW